MSLMDTRKQNSYETLDEGRQEAKNSKLMKNKYGLKAQQNIF